MNEAEKIVPEKKISGFIIPSNVMDNIMAYIGRGPWLEVNELINHIRMNSKPLYKTTKDETENRTTPDA